MTMEIRYTHPFIKVFLITATVVGVYFGIENKNFVERIQHQNILLAVTREDPVSYQFGQQGPEGFELALTQAFSDWLGTDLHIRVERSHTQIYNDLHMGIGQLGAAVLSTVDNTESLLFSQPYLEVSRVLIYRESGTNSLEDLAGQKILVQQDSPSAQWLNKNHANTVEIIPKKGTSTDLLIALENGEAAGAVMDSIEFEVDSGYFPELKIADDLTDPIPIRWAFSANFDSSLRDEANLFIAAIKKSGLLNQLIERYFGTLEQLNYSGINIFQNKIETRLPQYRSLFVEAAAQYQLDWRLLAAIGYQESHWRPRAVSPTGVRGIMMLTRATSRSVGVKNRLDPVESIFGGAKFFDRLTRVIPADIPEPDRTWFALAAYNVGSGHLQDARKLTAKLGFDRDSWLDVMKHLPLLEQKEYYKDLKFGRARGSEPVKYVQNIRRYYDLLRWNFPNEGELAPLPKALQQLPPMVIDIPSSL